MKKESHNSIPKKRFFYDLSALIEERIRKREKRGLEEIESTEIPEEESTHKAANPREPTPTPESE